LDISNESSIFLPVALKNIQKYGTNVHENFGFSKRFEKKFRITDNGINLIVLRLGTPINHHPR
jgi:hypothetical protein